MSRRDKEEKLLQQIIEKDGIKKIQDAITAVVSGTVDVSDRQARLLGIMYGNRGQLLQKPDSFDLIVQLRSGGVAEYDARQVMGDYAGTPTRMAVDSSGKLRVVTT